MTIKTKGRRHSRRGLVAALIAAALTPGLLFTPLTTSVAGANPPPIQVLLETPGGLRDITPQCSYQHGLVYEIASGSLLGRVPNPAVGTLVNAANQPIGIVNNIPN